jgi:hypothetical protein
MSNYLQLAHSLGVPLENGKGAPASRARTFRKPMKGMIGEPFTFRSA